MSLTNTHDPALERGRLCVVIATIVINVIAVSLLTFAPWSDWRTGAALNLSIIVCSLGLLPLGVTHCWRDFFSSELESDSLSLPPTRGWSITLARSISPSAAGR